MKSVPALLALEDGSVFYGTALGIEGQTVGEVVFNTSMTGYQEILTDPSYAKQIITLTYPHIGNVGTNAEDPESSAIWAAGLIVREQPLYTRQWRMQQSLPEYLRAHNIVAIAEIDTRKLTRLLREKGALNGCIVAGPHIDPHAAVLAAQSCPSMHGLDLAQVVSTKQPYTWTQGVWQLESGYPELDPNTLPYHVVAYDFGIKRNILRRLASSGCRLTVVPAKTSAQEALALKPDGIFLSNGPGDPAPCDYAITAIQEFLKTDIPIFGICLGHQLLGLATGAKTLKMKFGHRGANHPVQNLETGQVFISSQNHGFAVEEASLPPALKATHKSLFDGTLQGIRHTTKPAFGFQGHPEASPGPHDVSGLFRSFINLIKA